MNSVGQSESLQEVLERVRAAVGPSQELDAHVVCATIAPSGSFVTLGPISGHYRVCIGETERGKDLVWEDWLDWRSARPTASVDAALSLVDRAMPGTMWAVGCMEGGPFCRLVYPNGRQNGLGTGWGFAQSLEQEGGPDSAPLAVLSCLIAAKLDLLTGASFDGAK